MDPLHFLTMSDVRTLKRIVSRVDTLGAVAGDWGGRGFHHPTVVRVPAGGLLRFGSAECIVQQGPTLGDLGDAEPEQTRLVWNPAYRTIREDELIVIVWAVVENTRGGWVVAGHAGQTILGGTMNEDIEPFEEKLANLETHDPVHPFRDLLVSLEWAHGNQGISAGKEIIIADRGEDRLVVAADCEDDAAPISTPTLEYFSPTTVLFDSTGPDYVTAPVALTGNTFTVKIKVYTTASPGSDSTLFDARDAAGDGFRLLMTTGGEFSCTVNGGTAVTTATWTHNTWGEIECTYDGATLSIQHIGNSPVTNAESGTVAVTTACRVGCNSFDTNKGFDGYVEFVEVDDAGDLFDWYFRESAGTNVSDETSAGNDGTLTTSDAATFWAGGKVSTTAQLTWASDGSEWDVYFGTPTTFQFRERVSVKTWNPGALSAAQEYAWRVIADPTLVNTVGPYLRFTTA